MSEVAHPRRKVSAEERFWSKVAMPNENGCRLWTGSLGRSGYGAFMDGNWKTTAAHRFAWSLVNGPIPRGGFICHRCDVPACVNPDHLFLGDHAANMADRRAKGRYACGEVHHRAKLTSADVVRLRADYAAGRRDRDIAAEFGIDRMTVRRIAIGLTWSHVPGAVARRVT